MRLFQNDWKVFEHGCRSFPLEGTGLFQNHSEAFGHRLRSIPLKRTRLFHDNRKTMVFIRKYMKVCLKYKIPIEHGSLHGFPQ